MKVLAVIKEEFLPQLNVPVGIDANPMVTIHQEDLHFAVGLGAVVGKPYFASDPEKCQEVSLKTEISKTLPGSIHTKVIIKIEHIGTFCFVINLSSSLTFLLNIKLWSSTTSVTFISRV